MPDPQTPTPPIGASVTTLDYATRESGLKILVLSRRRAALFLLIAAFPLYACWPAVSLLGSYGLLISMLLVGTTAVTTLLAFVASIVWQAIHPLQPREMARCIRRRNRVWITLGVAAVLTPTGLPTRAILIAHVPLFALFTRDITPGANTEPARPSRYIGIYKVYVSTYRGGLTISTDPWWGLGDDDGNIAWDGDGSRAMVYDTAGDGRLIGKWIWWDLE